MTEVLLSYIRRCIFGIAACVALSSAPSSYARDPRPISLQVGAGDMLFETAVWSATVPKPGSVNLRENLSWTPHMTVNCCLPVADWFSVGAEVDFQRTAWDSVGRDASGSITYTNAENFYNLTVAPVLRFNYCRLEHFGMYSSLAAGVTVNGGSQTDELGRKTVAGIAADIRLLGVKAGSGMWWGFIDVGFLAAMRDRDHIFMFGSSLVRAGIEIDLLWK